MTWGLAKYAARLGAMVFPSRDGDTNVSGKGRRGLVQNTAPKSKPHGVRNMSPQLSDAIRQRAAQQATHTKRDQLAARYQETRSHRDLRDLQNLTHQALSREICSDGI